MIEPITIRDFEQYAAEHGASRQDYGDAALHRSNSSVSGAARRAALAAQSQRDADLTARREALRVEYKNKLASGELREMTELERLQQTAAGHPDNPSVAAARRLLVKRNAARHPSHCQFAERKRLSTPCSAWHMTFGGLCLNCGWRLQ